MRYLRPMVWTSLQFRLASVSFLTNLAAETSVVFLPLYAKDLGSSNLEVGLIAAIYGIAFFLASLLFGRQADLHGRLRFIRLGLGLSSAAYLSQIVAQNPISLLASRGFIGFCLGITTAAVMAYTYDNQKQIGRFLSYGSLGWLFGALIAAAVKSYIALFSISAISSLIAFMASLKLREEHSTQARSVLPVPLTRENRSIYLSFFFRQLGANAIWAIFPLYLASIGASKSWIAILDVINVAAQFFALRFVERFDPAKVFRAGFVVSAVVFAIYGVTGNYLYLIPVQVLLAVAWVCLFIGALGYLLRRNTERGTVSGQLYSTIYLSASLGPFMGGAVSQAWGFNTLMYLGSSLSVLGFFSTKGVKSRE